MKAIIVSVFFIFCHLSPSAWAGEKILTMGYKDKSKPPLIGDASDNAGLYKELFELAAKNLGYTLKIVRQPKVRIHSGLENGTIDFYPGASFSEERANYLYFFPNGLKTKEVLISLNNLPEIKDIAYAHGRLLVDLGSSKQDWGKKYPRLEVVQLHELPIESAIKALKHGRGTFFIADIEPLDYYKKTNNIKDLSDIWIKVHPNAINKEYVAMNLGFSRKSPLFDEVPNPHFDASKEVSLDNFPTLISQNCIAYQLSLSLRNLAKQGVTQQLYLKYFTNN